VLNFPWCSTQIPVFQEDVHINSNLGAQLRTYCILPLRYLRETPTDYIAVRDKHLCSYEWDVFLFGCLFYEVLLCSISNLLLIHYTSKTLYDIDLSHSVRTQSTRLILDRPSEPEINENTWQLIQRCCAENPKDRPTINEVVEEVQSWEYNGSGCSSTSVVCCWCPCSTTAF
jgi:serine/threonine protein kinase